MGKKYGKLFKSMEGLIHRKNEWFEVLICEYIRYVNGCRCELEELDIEEKRYDIARMYVQ
jgi:hypothetical protein